MGVVIHGSFDEGPIALALPDYFEGIWSATETDPVFSAWDKSTGISITQSQISDGGTIVNTGDLSSISIDTSGTIEASNISGSNTGDQNLSGYVPYTGASSNVNLTGRIVTAQSITITASPSNTTDAATKGYVDTLVATGSTWADAVLDIVSSLPGGPDEGDRYILSTTNQINEYTGGVWVATTPASGTTLYVLGDDSAPTNNIGLYTFNGTSWVYMGSTSAHNDLTGLQGGTTAQYYHLTSAQRTNLIQAATSGSNGYLTSTDWSTFNAKVGKSGSPASTYLATWSSSSAITGTSGMTYDGEDLVVTGNIRATGEISAYDTGAPINWWDDMPEAAIGVLGGIEPDGTATHFFNGEGEWVEITDGGGASYPSGSGIPIVVSGSSWGTTITDNHVHWDTAYSWGDWAAAVALKASIAGPTFTGNVIFPGSTRIGSNGWLGILTSSPAYPLDVVGAARATSYRTTNWSIEESGVNLVIKYGSTVVASISSAGLIKAKADMTAYASSLP